MPLDGGVKGNIDSSDSNYTYRATGLWILISELLINYHPKTEDKPTGSLKHDFTPLSTKHSSKQQLTIFVSLHFARTIKVKAEAE